LEKPKPGRAFSVRNNDQEDNSFSSATLNPAFDTKLLKKEKSFSLTKK